MGVGVLFALLAVRVYDPFPLDALRLGAFDLYQRLQPREVSAERPVVIVAIDEPSLKAHREWPWPRHVLARLTEILAGAEPRVVVFDFIFAEPDRTNPSEFSRSHPGLPEAVQRPLSAMTDNDQLFAEAISKIPVVLGFAGYWVEAEHDLRQPMRATVVGGDEHRFVPRVGSLVRAIPALEGAAHGNGMVSLIRDHDSIVRRLPTVFAFQDRLYPSLAIETIRVATRAKVTAFSADAAGPMAISVGNEAVRLLDRRGRIWPHFARSRDDLYVSAGRVLAGDVDNSRFRDKIVLIGATAIGLGDFTATPITPILPGVEVQAQAVEAILTRSLLHRPQYVDAAELSLILGAGVGLIVGVAATPLLWSLAVFLGAGGAIGLLSWFLFTGSRFLLDPVYPIIALVILYLTCVIVRGVMLERAARDLPGS